MNKILYGAIIVLLVGVLSPMISSAQVENMPKLICNGDVSCIDKRVEYLLDQVNKLTNTIQTLEKRISVLESKSTKTCPAGCTCSGDVVTCPAGPVIIPTTPVPIAGPTDTSNAEDKIGIKYACSADGTSGDCSVKPTLQAVPTVTSTDGIKTIQSFLKAEGSFTYPTATGFYGTVTKEAVKQFQTKQSIPVTGKIDTQTLNKMKALAPSIAPSATLQIQKLTVPSSQ